MRPDKLGMLSGTKINDMCVGGERTICCLRTLTLLLMVSLFGLCIVTCSHCTKCSSLYQIIRCTVHISCYFKLVSSSNSIDEASLIYGHVPHLGSCHFETLLLFSTCLFLVNSDLHKILYRL